MGIVNINVLLRLLLRCYLFYEKEMFETFEKFFYLLLWLYKLNERVGKSLLLPLFMHFQDACMGWSVWVTV
jgi:hypothetical protein